jgi:hypothetical protein
VNELEILTRKIDQLALELQGVLRAVNGRCGENSQVARKLLGARLSLTRVEKHLEKLGREMKNRTPLPTFQGLQGRAANT